MAEDYLTALRNAEARAAAVRDFLRQHGPKLEIREASEAVQRPAIDRGTEYRGDIYEALAAVDQRLADNYSQAYADLADVSRVSWAGTAHEIRELLATTLRLLAPDQAVKERAWFKPESQDGRPTQKQRVKYILEARRAGSTEHEVVEQIDLIEERVGNLVRSTYGRASDAAHRSKRRSEAKRILNYFEAFAHDLLDLP